MAYCGQLAKEFSRFKEDFDVVGRHIGNAQQTKYGESGSRTGELERLRDDALSSEPSTRTRSSSERVSPVEPLRAIDAA